MPTAAETMRRLANEFEEVYAELCADELLNSVDPDATRRRAHRYLAAAASLDMLADELEGKNG